MNKFDEIFFWQYVSKWTKIITLVHKHIIVIIDKIIINYFFWAIIPSFLYYYSDVFKSYIPFFALEIFLIWIFFKWIYDIFDWYNDVWIITEDWVIDLEWSLFSSDSVAVKYESIEWLELVENWIIDSILWKWNILIHKIGSGNPFMLENASNASENIHKIDKKLKEEKKKHWENAKRSKNIEQNFETVLKALSQVVEWYLEDSWYKKDDSEEKKAIIKEVKKMWWVVDLSK